MLAPGDTTMSEQVLLRNRLGRFGLVAAGLGTLGIVFRFPKQLTGPGIHVDLSLLLQGLGVLIPLLLFLVCRRRGLPRRVLRLLDCAAAFLTSCAYGWMGWKLAGPANGLHAQVAQLITLLAINYVAFARAALVPSSARRTVWVTGACVLALLPVSLRAPLNTFSHGPSDLIGSVVSITMWSTLTIALAWFISSVIYGLRRDVKAAREFGQYQLLELIGSGGMGMVYRARHRMLRRDTALKLLPPTRSSAHAISRFEREVQLTAQLSHPHTVTIFDYGRTPDGLFYYTMELLEGATLEDIVAATGPMPPARVVRILRQIAGALAEAHELGLVHRDIKPSNIMLCTRGGEADVAKVLDFGLVRDQVTADPDARHGLQAKSGEVSLRGPAGGSRQGQRASSSDVCLRSLFGARGRRPVSSALAAASRTVSESGPPKSLLVGTPLYISPEAIVRPDQVSAASDLYSLGAVAYHMLSGAPPFQAATIVELCSHHLWTAPPPLPSRAMVPSRLEELVMAALAKDPAARPASARALGDELDALALPGWSESEARTWWREQAARIAEQRSPAPARLASGRRAIEVDLDRRVSEEPDRRFSLRGLFRRLWPLDAPGA